MDIREKCKICKNYATDDGVAICKMWQFPGRYGLPDENDKECPAFSFCTDDTVTVVKTDSAQYIVRSNDKYEALVAYLLEAGESIKSIEKLVIV